MPTLTKDDLLFLKRAEGMSLFFEKIGAAKKLISEAQVEMAQFARTVGKMAKKPKTKAHKTLRRAKKIEFGVDLPDEMSDPERKVYTEIQKAGTDGSKPRELMAALKMSLSQVGRATRALKKRKLIASTGATLSLTWKVK